MLHDFFTNVTTILLAVCSAWTISVGEDSWKRSGEWTSEWRGKTFLIISMVFGAIAILFTLVPFLVYLITRERKMFLLLVFASYCLVFSSVFIRMTITEIDFNNIFSDRIDKSYVRNMSQISELSLGVGFLCAGTFSVLFCKH